LILEKKMTAQFRINKNTVLSLMAAGLLSATALVGSFAVVTPVRAEMATTMIDPSQGFADLVDRVMPGVVSVEVQFENVVAEDGQGQQRRGGGAGSGFIISADGYVVTNNHVVQNATEVKVKIKGGEELFADVIGTDAKTDLALIKIKSDKTFQFVKFAEANSRVGDWVMAVGNPFGLGGSVTTGIVSALGRDIGSGPYDDFMQIDASINKGNSGGPAFNLSGEVIGVNTAIYSPSGGSVGIGFAIPAAMTKDVIDSLKSSGMVTRGWLGVQIQPVTAEIAEGLGLKSAKGAIISDVTAGSPALTAGLETGDTILKIGGTEIEDARDLAKTIARVKPNQSVDMDIVRDGKAMTIAVKIGTMPGEQQARLTDDKIGAAPSLANLGLKVAPAEDGEGVKIIGIEPKSAAADRGLKVGDVILEIAGQDVEGLDDVKSALQDAGDKRVLMLVRSGENQRYIALPRAKT
jgi:serine protease Do